MNWTKTPPTRPGAYWWRASEKDTEPELCPVFTGSRGELRVWSLSDASRGADYELLPCWGGEWCLLVPVEEVEKAWNECAANTVMPSGYSAWLDSRARRIVEGEEV